MFYELQPFISALNLVLNIEISILLQILESWVADLLKDASNTRESICVASYCVCFMQWIRMKKSLYYYISYPCFLSKFETEHLNL